MWSTNVMPIATVLTEMHNMSMLFFKFVQLQLNKTIKSMLLNILKHIYKYIVNFKEGLINFIFNHKQ